MITDITALVIVHFGDKEILYRCVKSIEKDNFYNLRVIIVNNATQDLKFEESKEISVVNTEENRGYAAACNTGICKAQELGVTNFILCNNDVQFTEEFFSLFLPRVKEIEYPIIAAPKINYLDKPDSVWYAGGKINKFKLEGIHLTNQQKSGFVETEFISGCCFYISQDAFKIIGLLDDNYFLYEEDLDYSLRAKAKDVKLLVDTNVIIFHDESSSVKESTRIGKYKSEIYFHKLRSKVLITNKYAKFPYKIFNKSLIFYKFLKYTLLSIFRAEFNYMYKLFSVIKSSNNI